MPGRSAVLRMVGPKSSPKATTATFWSVLVRRSGRSASARVTPAPKVVIPAEAAAVRVSWRPIGFMSMAWLLPSPSTSMPAAAMAAATRGSLA